MPVKIDTKEKFHVVTLDSPELTAILADSLGKTLVQLQQLPVKNIILNLKQVASVENTVAETLVNWQSNAYEQQRSFVICCLTSAVEAQLEDLEVLELLNATPTESEAWDIVQMEEIERELLGDEE